MAEKMEIFYFLVEKYKKLLYLKNVKVFMKVLSNFFLPKRGLKSVLFSRDAQSSNYKHTHFFGLKRIGNLIYNRIILR